ncbi:hypothetical protein ACHAXR_003228 [Thalassiosira sp. AJA248-18]
MKPSSKGDPGIMYLGVKLEYTQTANGVWAWGMGNEPSKYVREAVTNCKKHLAESNDECPKSIHVGIRYPDLDSTAPCDPDQASYYMPIIGVLRWIVGLRRIHINTKVLLLSSYLAHLREGHL